MRRRILTVMTVALVMAAMIVAMAAPAFAQRAVDPFVGGVGSREVNISLLALSNPPGGLVFVQHDTLNFHGTGDPTNINCTYHQTRPSDLYQICQFN